GSDIGYVNNLLCARDAVKTCPWARTDQRLKPSGLSKSRRRVVHRDYAEGVTFTQIHRAELGFADAGGALQHRPERWLQLAGGAADDLKNLRGRRLLLQRLASLPPCLVSVTLCFRKLAGPGFQLLLQSFN